MPIDEKTNELIKNSIHTYYPFDWEKGQFERARKNNELKIFHMVFVIKNRLHELGVDDKEILDTVDCLRKLLIRKNL